MTYYFAYGMNTDKHGMSRRCPSALPIGMGTLKGYKLVMRGCADVVLDMDSTMEGAVWKLTPECEAALDRLESFPSYYGKVYVDVMCNGEKIRCMMYQMCREYQNSMSPAGAGYYQTLYQGYSDFGISLEQLRKAQTLAQGMMRQYRYR